MTSRRELRHRNSESQLDSLLVVPSVKSITSGRVQSSNSISSVLSSSSNSSILRSKQQQQQEPQDYDVMIRPSVSMDRMSTSTETTIITQQQQQKIRPMMMEQTRTSGLIEDGTINQHHHHDANDMLLNDSKSSRRRRRRIIRFYSSRRGCWKWYLIVWPRTMLQRLVTLFHQSLHPSTMLETRVFIWVILVLLLLALLCLLMVILLLIFRPSKLRQLVVFSSNHQDDGGGGGGGGGFLGRGHRWRNTPVRHVPTNKHVTAIIMNHNRPQLLQHSTLLETLTLHPSIQEVLLLHTQASTAFTYPHPKVINMDATQANERMGLSLRFHYCHSKASNDWILMMDDDQEITTASLDALLVEFDSDSSRIVGRYGRAFSYWLALSPFRHGYSTITWTGRVEVVLTKCMMMRRDLCPEFHRYQSLVWDDLVQPESHPLWNGEDIFMSLVANHVYGVPSNGPYNNYAMSLLDVTEATLPPGSSSSGVTEGGGAVVDQHDSVSGNLDRKSIFSIGPWAYLQARWKAEMHARYRGRLWATAKERLNALTDDDYDHGGAANSSSSSALVADHHHLGLTAAAAATTTTTTNYSYSKQTKE